MRLEERELASPNGLVAAPVGRRTARRRRRGGVKVLAAVSVVLVLAAAGAVVVVRSGDDGGQAAPERATGRATVTRQDLTARTDVDGTLGFSGLRGPSAMDSASQVLNQSAGTLTAVPAEGTTIERGQALYRVDNRPVPLLYGDLPAWRRLAVGVPDGPDVRQLEANLVALGYLSEADDTFNAATAAAVRKWQESLGVAQTGALDPGDAVFLPGAVRVKSVKENVGTALRPGGPVLDMTGTTRLVRVDLDAAKQALVKVGDKVEVRLPDGKTTPGTVSKVASVAKTSGGQGGQGGKPVLPVEITLDQPSAAGSLDEAPVRVGIVTGSRTGVLAVPVNALLALREGGYGVRVLDGDGAGDGLTSRIVAVETGLFAKGLVEVKGDGLEAGLVVEVPAS